LKVGLSIIISLRQHLLRVLLGGLGPLVLALNCQAQQVISVGIHEALEIYVPQKVQDIKAALASTGLAFDFLVLPNERSIRMALNGDLAIDLYRQPKAMKDHTHMIQVLPAVDKLEFWLYTSSQTPSLCNKTTHSYSSVVGVLGIHWFEDYIYAGFQQHKVVHHFSQAYKLVSQGHVGVSLLTRPAIELEAKQSGLRVKVCGNEPFLTIKTYSYVHSDFSWVIPKIEQAYRQHLPPL